MDAQWIKSPTGRRVLEHWADPRPSWLWSADGQTLLWRNLTARLFPGRGRKGNLPAPEAVPIRGQISRLVRLGTLNHASLSRMQFLAGERPISATCACTPLALPDGQTALLVVYVDPIAGDLLDGVPVADRATEALFPPGADYLLIDDDVQIAGGSPRAIEHYAPVIESQGLPNLDDNAGGTINVEGLCVPFTRFKASLQDASLLLFESPAPTAAIVPAPTATAATAEPLLPMGLPPIEAPPTPTTAHDEWPEGPSEAVPATGGLTSLFDRLLDDGALFAPLRPDEDFAAPAFASVADAVTEPLAREEQSPAEETVPQHAANVPEAYAPVEPPTTEPLPETAPIETAEGETEAEPEAMPSVAPPLPASTGLTHAAPTLFRVVGRSFTSLAAAPAINAQTGEAAATPSDPVGDVLDQIAPSEGTIAEAGADGAASEPKQPADVLVASGGDEAATPAPSVAPVDVVPEPARSGADDADNVERVSRYNFDELSRILTDRVGNGEAPEAESGRAAAQASRAPLAAVPSATPEGALVTLGGETLVLNRLPLGIMVFRDQQVLFANRAITEMVGYESVESLRHAGLAAIFPAAAGETQQEAGPVNHLVQRDGTLVPVTARLQSVSWQGKPALMLSASATEVRTAHESAVRAFAELLAQTRADGFIDLARSGAVTEASIEAQIILGSPAEKLVGRPLSQLVAAEEVTALKEFLERPARFAETARPAITLKAAVENTEIQLFAQGQAGVVSGYFGFLRRLARAPLPLPAPRSDEPDTALLARLSRGVRRPLNTVIGFSDLIGSAAFGPIDNARYLEYAGDIKTAGLEIATLVDELDDFARLRDGRYSARPSDIDLQGLLESAIARVRTQASAARVLVRSAISENLPRVRADRASLAQAVLNLLASAIDQTPQDGSVVLSAQVDDEGGIVVNVRDSARGTADLGERFVVFRDGVGRDGEILAPVRSSVGLALTRALLAVNASTLSVDPAGSVGTLFSLTIPPENVVFAPPPLPKPAS